jgi:hypothetical protein
VVVGGNAVAVAEGVSVNNGRPPGSLLSLAMARKI